MPRMVLKELPWLPGIADLGFRTAPGESGTRGS